MSLKAPLTTPEEAYRLFCKTPIMTMFRAMEIADHCEQHNDTSVSSVLGCIWNAGRVQGIREERQKRRRRRPDTAEHLARMYQALPPAEKQHFNTIIAQKEK